MMAPLLSSLYGQEEQTESTAAKQLWEIQTKTGLTTPTLHLQHTATQQPTTLKPRRSTWFPTCSISQTDKAGTWKKSSAWRERASRKKPSRRLRSSKQTDRDTS